MSPEQARGKTADMRADIWAFGVVLFETLAGTRPFEGDEVSDTLAGILKSEPAWQLLPSDVPAVVRRLLRRCLQKDRRARLQHIGDARLDIEEAQQGPSSDSDVPQASSRQVRLAWASAIGFGVLAAIIAASAVYRRAPAVPELPEMRVDVSGPQGLFGSQFAISPDGRAIAFSTGDSQRRQIWVRSLDDPSPKPLAGTEGSEYPFWSPDSRSIGFFANNKLKRVDLDGGVQQLANVLTPAGGTWNRDGTILFVPNDSAGVMSVPATGGEARLVTPQREPRLATRLPQFLPDGRRFLFFVARGGEPAGVYVGELGSDSIRRVLAADRPAVYGSGHVWFVRDGDLFAQRFDATTLTLSGAVSRVAQNVGLGLVVASLSASATGPIAYRTVSEVQPQGGRRGLTWFDRTGKDLGRVGEEGGFASNPGMSADGRHVVMQRTVQENIDIWLLDLSRNVSSRLTDQPGIDSLPIWSPDGTRVAFSTQSAKRFGIAVLRIDRLAESEIVLSASPASGSSAEDVAGAKIACDWSPDGRLIMYKQVELNLGNTDLWVVPVSSPDKPVQLVATPADERDGQFSPDGKWIAYESNESGRPQIYVQPFPGPGRKVPISTGGGSQVRWRRDGKELFYIAPDDSLMAVAFDPTGQSDVGVPTPLFRTSIAPIRTISRQQYVVSSDGQRFLIVTSDAPLAVTPVTLLLNWKGVSP
jgi:Tol biopolymer transport system component